MELGLNLLSCCGLRAQMTAEEIQAEEANKKINKKIREYKQQTKREQKILLLGTGECGKSTFIKQMRIILGGGFPPEQYEYYKRVIHKNLLQAGASLASAMRTLGIPYEDERLTEEAVELINDFNENFQPELLSEKHEDLVKRLWKDSGIQSCYDRRREFQLLDSAKYFLDNVDELTKESYKVTLQDILRSRVKTTGIIEEVFHVDRVDLKIIDVGGQRRERRRWIHCFEGVTSVIFLASLSEYDMTLYECSTRNRTEESLQLFQEMCKYDGFSRASFILFLNKKDLLEEKVKRVDIADYLPEYTGPKQDYEAALSFFKNMFIAKRHEVVYDSSVERAPFFVHITCATDTSNIQRIFDAIKTTLLSEHLHEMGLT